MKTIRLLFFIVLTTAAVLSIVVKAKAENCPPGVKACKVITVTPEEEASLSAPNQILDTAQAARYLDLNQNVLYWRKKLSEAPFGSVSPLAPTDGTGNPPKISESKMPKGDKGEKKN